MTSLAVFETAASDTVGAMKPILVIEQEYSLRGLGLLGERLEASGLPYRSLGAWNEPIDEVVPSELAAIIAMGGNAHAWEADRIPALRDERVLLREAVEADLPVFGICLGGQLLASAVGGNVRAAETPEIGLARDRADRWRRRRSRVQRARAGGRRLSVAQRCVRAAGGGERARQ